MKDVEKVGAAIGWTAAIGAALGRTFGDYPALTVWAILAAAMASCATAGLIVDYVAEHTARCIVTELIKERDATVAATVDAIHEYGDRVADRTVERLASKQDKTLERMAAELARTLRNGDESRPTPIR